MATEQHNNSGILFTNDRKEKDTQPDKRGFATVNGVEYYVSGWMKEGERGKFMTLAFKPKEQKPDAATTSEAEEW